MVFGKVARRMALKNMTAQLRFPKVHLNKPHDLCNNVLWTDKTKVDFFGYNAQHWVQPNCQLHLWRTEDLGHEFFCIPKYFRVRHEVVYLTAKSWLKQLCIRAMILNTAGNWHQNGWKKKRNNMLQCPSQCPDLNATEMLWWDFERAVHKWMAANPNELKNKCGPNLFHDDIREWWSHAKIVTNDYYYT